jgi:hypothetical protein
MMNGWKSISEEKKWNTFVGRDGSFGPEPYPLFCRSYQPVKAVNGEPHRRKLDYIITAYRWKKIFKPEIDRACYPVVSRQVNN